MKQPLFDRLLSSFAFGLLILVWQGCADDTKEKRGGLDAIDAGFVEVDASTKSDRGSRDSKDPGDGAGRGGSEGSTGASGSSTGREENAAGRGAGGSGGAASTAGKGGAPAAGKGGASAGGQGGSAATGYAGATAGAAGHAAAGAGGAAGMPAAGPGAEAGAPGTTGESGAGGESGSGSEAGSGGAAGGDDGDAGTAGEATRCETGGGATCAAGEFCNFEPDVECGATDAGGTCEAVPEVCDAMYQPVCGCDNRTHANACTTHRDGISVKHDGLCTQDECTAAGGRPVLSDGASTPSCEQSEQVWSIESGGDEAAVCCLPGRPSARTCGGIAALDCDPREFCNYETSAGGQGCDGTVADAGGVCEAIPTACTLDYRPVCGCDKKTYSNACDAHASSTSVLHDGACTELDCAAVAGRVVYSSGPEPMCAPGEEQWTTVVDSSGALPIETAICCRQP